MSFSKIRLNLGGKPPLGEILEYKDFVVKLVSDPQFMRKVEAISGSADDAKVIHNLTKKFGVDAVADLLKNYSDLDGEIFIQAIKFLSPGELTALATHGKLELFMKVLVKTKWSPGSASDLAKYLEAMTSANPNFSQMQAALAELERLSDLEIPGLHRIIRTIVSKDMASPKIAGELNEFMMLSRLQSKTPVLEASRSYTRTGGLFDAFKHGEWDVITPGYIGEIKSSWQKYNKSNPKGSQFLSELKFQLKRHQLAGQEIWGKPVKIVVPAGEFLPQDLLDMIGCLGIGIVRV